jgi:hypothetical protein
MLCTENIDSTITAIAERIICSGKPHTRALGTVISPVVGSAHPPVELTRWTVPSSAPVKLFAAAVLTAAALGSSRGEEACGLFGELFRKLAVRTVPGIRVEAQPGIR